MKFKYKIEHYSEVDQKLFVLYFPEDSTKPVVGEYFPINTSMTQEDIEVMIVNGAPVHKWDYEINPIAPQLVGSVSDFVEVPTVEVVEQVQEEIVEDQEPKFTELQLKNYRNGLLRVTDFTQLQDYAGNIDKQNWVIYRQRLRDITKQFGWPEKVEWPATPDINVTNKVKLG